MKKTILYGKRYHLLFLLVMLLSGSVVHAEDKPFEIYNAADWVTFVNTVRGSYSGRNAVLMANINLGKEYDDKYIVGIMNPYLGEFDGNGYSIAIEDETTGTTVISKKELEMSNPDAPAYNLAGQKVNGDYKGIIIKNGKKSKKF